MIPRTVFEKTVKKADKVFFKKIFPRYIGKYGKGESLLIKLLEDSINLNMQQISKYKRPGFFSEASKMARGLRFSLLEVRICNDPYSQSHLGPTSPIYRTREVLGGIEGVDLNDIHLSKKQRKERYNKDGLILGRYVQLLSSFEGSDLKFNSGRWIELYREPFNELNSLSHELIEHGGNLLSVVISVIGHETIHLIESYESAPRINLPDIEEGYRVNKKQMVNISQLLKRA